MASPLFVDTRTGSGELVEPLKKLRLDIVPTRLESGDLMWEGRGEGGKPVLVGVEFKRLAELVESFRTGRLQGFQVPKMCEAYQYRYLLVEGALNYNSTGQLCRWRVRRGKRERVPAAGNMTVGELLRRLAVLHLCAGVLPILSADRSDTLQWLSVLYHTWTDVDLDQHKSHLGIYIPHMGSFLVSDTRRTLSTFPGVGMQFSRAAERTFGTVRQAALASADDWARLKTTQKGKSRCLGFKTGARIVNFLTGASR